jgi:SAM-dependent MidA family methyltransferase
VEVTLPAEPPWDWLPTPAPHGARLPIEEDAAAWVEAARSRLDAGTLICFDYGTARTAELAAGPWRVWLRTYRGQSRGGHYLDAPGTQDITAQVCLDQLPAADTTDQARFLREWGIADLVEQGRRAWTSAAATPDLRALAMRSRVREAEALLEPTGLGAFTVMRWPVSGHDDHPV